MDGKQTNLSVKDIALISILTAILFVQEQLLTNIPGIQLTILLMVLYSKKMGMFKTVLIIIIHVLLDNFVMSSFSLMYTPTMLVGWLIIPLTLCTIFKKVESPVILAILGAILAFIYCWLYMIPSYLIYNIKPLAYLLSDIIAEIILAGCSFLTIIFLYKPSSKLLDSLIKLH